jgi:acetyl-CoA carboxylase biotin carboxyl carrier protein
LRRTPPDPGAFKEVPMKLSEIQELMKSFDASGLTGLELTWDGATLRMQKGAAPAPGTRGEGAAVPAAPVPAPAAPAAPAPEEGEAPAGKSCLEVKAPIVGVVYAAPSPDAPPFIREGQQVEKGQPLCLIEAMKMMNQVEAPAAGVVKAIRYRNGELAEFGAVLVELETQ